MIEKKRKARAAVARKKKIVVLVVAVVALVVAAGWLYTQSRSESGKPAAVSQQAERPDLANPKPDNPISNRKFYLDTSRTVNKKVAEYQRTGDTAKADLMNRIASQPGTTWLNGPNTTDPQANRDIAAVQRTSTQAASQRTLPLYILYAIPNRDACAGYSGGGFRSEAAYLSWVDRIVKALKTEAVFVVEPDAIAHTIYGNCLTATEKNARYGLLKKVVGKLQQSKHTTIVYLDAGHSDWFANPAPLVGPLRKSGIDQARGVSVNISFFVKTTDSTTWSKRLVQLLGGDKGVIIDTSRNGKGIAPLTGEARWCNPPGRGLGPRPTTIVEAAHVDAYFWGKIIGESDGACFGKPAAGVFVPEIALELARNAVH